jgi:tRNA(Glu) U13 pseudouridine synthase TruD
MSEQGYDYVRVKVEDSAPPSIGEVAAALDGWQGGLSTRNSIRLKHLFGNRFRITVLDVMGREWISFYGSISEEMER